MSELKEVEKILYVELEEFGDNFPQKEYSSYSLYASKDRNSDFMLVHDYDAYMCEESGPVLDKIVKDLEYKYKELIGGTIKTRHDKNDFNTQIEKDCATLRVHSKYIDVFKSLMQKFENATSDKYDTRPKFGIGSVVCFPKEKCTVEEVHLAKAEDYKQEIEDYKYEYEYVLITESGYVRKMRESKLIELIEDA